MTEILTSSAVVLCGLLALSFAPPISRRLPGAPRSYQRKLLKGLIGVLIVFFALRDYQRDWPDVRSAFQLDPLGCWRCCPARFWAPHIHWLRLLNAKPWVRRVMTSNP